MMATLHGLQMPILQSLQASTCSVTSLSHSMQKKVTYAAPYSTTPSTSRIIYAECCIAVD